MTAHPIDTEALRRLADAATPGPWVATTCKPCAEHGREDIQIWDERGHIPIAQWMDEIDPDAGADAEFIAAAREAIPALLDALAAAEHRATRAEAQSAIRGRAVAIYRERARVAEADIEKRGDLILRALATSDTWQKRTKEAQARIKAVERLTYASDDGTEYEHNGYGPAEGEPECPGCWALDIRRALDGGA